MTQYVYPISDLPYNILSDVSYRIIVAADLSPLILFKGYSCCMLIHPNTSGPVIIHLGPILLPVYGIAFSLGLVIADYLGQQRLHQSRQLTANHREQLWFYLLIGIILGARIGDIIFYRLATFIHNPWAVGQNNPIQHNAWIGLVITSFSYIYTKWVVQKPFPVGLLLVPLLLLLTGDAGMSFHGALLGGVLAVLAYSRQFKQSFLDVMDFMTPLVPPGLGIGRVANFINGELWGRPTLMPWGVIFPRADFQVRHPSQLYECCLEGLLLFLIMWNFSKRPRPKGAVFGLAMVLYAIARMLVECFREPDPTIGIMAWGWLSMGQLLSIPMLVAGITILLRAYLIHGPMMK